MLKKLLKFHKLLYNKKKKITNKEFQYLSYKIFNKCFILVVFVCKIAFLLIYFEEY